MEITSLGYRTDLLLLELGGSTFRDTGEYVVVRTPANPGFWWGNFIVVCEDFANSDRWLAVFAAAHPTAEHIAAACWRRLRPHLPEHLALSVTLHETDRNFVEYHG